jgi:hypothetical protein
LFDRLEVRLEVENDLGESNKELEVEEGDDATELEVVDIGEHKEIGWGKSGISSFHDFRC